MKVPRSEPHPFGDEPSRWGMEAVLRLRLDEPDPDRLSPCPLGWEVSERNRRDQWRVAAYNVVEQRIEIEAMDA